MSILFYFLAFYKQTNWLIRKIIDMLINNENNHQFQLVLGDKNVDMFQQRTLHQ